MNTSEKLFAKFNIVYSVKYLHALFFCVAFLIGMPMFLWAQPNFSETFTYTDNTTTGTDWNSSNGAEVLSNQLSYTSPADGETYTIWQTTVLASNCPTDFVIIGAPQGSGVASSFFEYSVNSSTWNTVVSGSPFVGTQIELRLRVENILTGETVTLDDVMVYELLSANLVDQANVSCIGLNNGSITVTGACGRDNNYHYAWTGSPSGFTATTATVSNLEPGTYNVVVTNDNSETVSLGPYTITEPAAGVSFSLSTVKNWTCADPCSGSITVTASGGTQPYRYFLNGTEGTQLFTELCGAIGGTTYTVRVEDANGCTATPETRDTIIRRDITPPNCTTNFPPPNRLIETLSFPATAEIDTFDFGFAGYTCLGGAQPHPYDLDTVDYPIDASNFNGLQLKISISQTDVDTWDGTSDFLKVRISYNGGANWTDLLTDYCNWNASITNEAAPGGTCAGTIAALPTALINLNNADGVPNLVIQVICHSTDAAREYTVHDLMVRGNNITKSITWALSGEPSGCSDNYSVATITHNDGPITWHCNASNNLEFEFTRTWRVADVCNNSAIQNQRISVGTYPTFAVAPPDTIFDNCKVAIPVNIRGPEGADNCGTPTITWAVTTNGANVVPQSGTGNGISSITFPPPVEFDTTYVITWTVTDSAGFASTAVQNVTVRRPMVVNFAPVAAHFCSGTNASFTLSVSGGTGSYEIPSFTPAGTWAVLTNSSGTYSTTNLELGSATDIQVTWTDSNVAETGGTDGGCSVVSTYTNTGLYTIHQNISTNPLQRLP